MGASFERELGAAGAKAAEKKYMEKAGGVDEPSVDVLNKLDVPELSLETSEQTEKFVAAARARTAGSIDELRISESDLEAQGLKRGVNPDQKIKDPTSAKEYFGKGELNPLIESDTLAEARVRNPAIAERYASLKRERVSRQTDIMNLEQQIAAQKDETLKAAQMKVLGQFQRELATFDRELEGLEKKL